MLCGTARVAGAPSLLACHAPSEKLHCGPDEGRHLCPHRGLRDAHDPHSTRCTHPLAEGAVLQGLGQHLQPIVLQQGHLQAGSTIRETCDKLVQSAAESRRGPRMQRCTHMALADGKHVHWQAYNATPDTHRLQSEGGNPFLGVIWQL